MMNLIRNRRKKSDFRQCVECVKPMDLLCGQSCEKSINAVSRGNFGIVTRGAPFYIANQEKHLGPLLRPEIWAYFIKVAYRWSQF